MNNTRRLLAATADFIYPKGNRPVNPGYIPPASVVTEGNYMKQKKKYIFQYTVNTYQNSEAVQLSGEIEANDDFDAIRRLILQGTIDEMGYEFLGLDIVGVADEEKCEEKDSKLDRVIKAYERCLSDDSDRVACSKCPYLNASGCRRQLSVDAVDLLRSYKELVEFGSKYGYVEFGFGDENEDW